jgi:tRNA G10  N-methylase Trm11
MVKTNQLRDILSIRTYRELLFAVDGMKIVPNDVVSAAKMLADGTILKFLDKRHQGVGAYRFRLEMKTKMDSDKKIAFVKRLSSEIEHLSERKLLNSVNHYEFELRLVENKEGKFNVLLRLYTLADERFDYRKEVLPTSIHPSNASLCVALAAPYLKEDAQLLDPFCGVGTMLIERNLAVKAKSMYGIDSLSEAIDKARINTKRADMIVNYINRDFFDFKHEYLFDEIITNMPTVGRLMSERDLTELYQRFFEKAKVHLKEDAILVLYTHNQAHVRKFASGRNYRIEKEFEISMMEGTYVYVIRYRG